MTAEIIRYAPEQAEIRTLLLGETPWFVAKDVCDVLAIKDPSMALRGFPEDEKGTTTIGTPGGSQDMLIVNEPGLYRLIFTSRKPEAEAFKRWVFHEVLPMIRRYGRYVPTAAEPPAIQGRARAGSRSPYVGVTYLQHKARRGHRPWWARLYVAGRALSLGLHDTAEKAARAYDRAAIDLYGNHARLNFPHQIGA